MVKDCIQEAFFELLRAGLWEKEVRLSTSDIIDFKEVLQIAEEQSVVGLVVAGIEHVKGFRLPQADVLTIAGKALQIEQQNIAMNQFVAELFEKLQKENIHALLVKGQGIAQCFERSLWRTCGDVDLLLNEENYHKAQLLLMPLADNVDTERGKHQGLTIGKWTVELHGNQHCGLLRKMDSVIDDVQQEACKRGKVRTWTYGNTSICLPAPNEDVVFIFTHFLKHFYKGGLGLRQICDWCRLLWTYKDEIDKTLLSERLKAMRLISEWKAFGAFAVDYLGIPVEAMPFYSSDAKWKRKARRIYDFILEVGNFGHNRDMSYYNSKPYLVRKSISLGRRCGDLFRHAQIFPLDSMRFMPSIIFNGLRSAAKGE